MLIALSQPIPLVMGIPLYPLLLVLKQLLLLVLLLQRLNIRIASASPSGMEWYIYPSLVREHRICWNIQNNIPRKRYCIWNIRNLSIFE
uniref:Uncharacterized protein n=2 Tax=Picea TaxID=3328 RepID=A0A101M3V3_PICGL|nr:hypothetical protein ABT39_MTgene252 [Picea glauca]QHR90133.1 hypothetical protein Q903MT_gene4156 [Picea sitchensis]